MNALECSWKWEIPVYSPASGASLPSSSSRIPTIESFAPLPMDGSRSESPRVREKSAGSEVNCMTVFVSAPAILPTFVKDWTVRLRVIIVWQVRLNRVSLWLHVGSLNWARRRRKISSNWLLSKNRRERFKLQRQTNNASPSPINGTERFRPRHRLSSNERLYPVGMAGWSE